MRDVCDLPAVDLDLLGQPIRERELVRLHPDGDIEAADEPGRLPEHVYWHVIEDHRLQTAEDLVRWLHHLSCKGWFTASHTCQLIEAFCAKTGNRLCGEPIA